jgi:hypothetical protein
MFRILEITNVDAYGKEHESICVQTEDYRTYFFDGKDVTLEQFIYDLIMIVQYGAKDCPHSHTLCYDGQVFLDHPEDYNTKLIVASTNPNNNIVEVLTRLMKHFKK